MSASEKLKALQRMDSPIMYGAPLAVWDALPQIIALAEAAEAFVEPWPDLQHYWQLKAPLAALEKALS